MPPKLRFILALLGIAISCVIAPILLWHDYKNGDWFMVTVDVAIIWLWGDWLRRQFKAANKDW